MNRRTFGLGLAASAFGLVSCETTQMNQVANALLGPNGGGELSLDVIIAGLKEALEVGTANAVRQTSARGGFADNLKLRIKSPDKIRKVTDTMKKIGMGAQVDHFEAKMNEAAEQAAGQATTVFVNAVRQMTITDAKKILQGKDTAATEYFRKKTEVELTARFEPIVSKHMQQVGAVDAYNRLIDRYHAIPLVPRANFDAEDYVTEQALNGLFLVISDEERKIRENPAARTTELLRRVFG